MKSGLPISMALIGLCCLGFAATAETASAADRTGALRQTLSAQEARLGRTNPALLPALDKLAQERWRDGDLAEAVVLRRRALGIAVHAFGNGSPRAAEAMIALAQAHIDRRQYLDAEPLLIIAATVLEGGTEPASPALADAFAGLARIAAAHGSAEAGANWAERAIEAAKSRPQRSSKPLLALAAVRASEERFADSEQLVREALARDRERFSPDGLAVARDLSQLGNLYLRQKRYAEALPLLQQAAAIDQQALGPAHPFIADDFYDFGLALDGLKRPDQAGKSLAFAVKLLGSGSEKDSLRLAYAERELARVLRAAGKDEAAKPAAEGSKRILDKIEDEERDRERQI